MSEDTQSSNAAVEDYHTTGVPTRGHQRDLDDVTARLQHWFRQQLPELAGLEVRNVRPPDGSGVANETLLCDGVWTDAAGEHTRSFVIRIKSTDFLYKDVDFASHRLMYQALADVPGVPVPNVVGFDDDATILGGPFFVMDRVEGRVPPDTPTYQATGWVLDLPEAERAALWRDSVEVMARLHQVPPSKLPFLQRPSLGATGLDQDLAYWRDYQQWALAGRPNHVIETTERWLLANLPKERVTELAWGDSRIGNMIFQDNKVVAVLDWDMVSLAGAESDLAWWAVMDYEHTETVGVTRPAGIGSPNDTVRLWQECVGREARDLWFHSVYANYRLAVILVRLADLMADALPPEVVNEFLHNNDGMQYLASMLEIPMATEPRAWPGLSA